jgi:hypothetical protein
MLYELRIYNCVPGRLPALLKRFETVTLKIWQKVRQRSGMAGGSRRERARWPDRRQHPKLHPPAHSVLKHQVGRVRAADA